MKKLVYIAGLAHSGSTLLDLLIGQHPRFVALGEVMNVRGAGLKHTLEKNTQCTCGANLQTCEFWSKAVPDKHADTQISVQDHYRNVLSAFQEIYGADILPVDSSKKIRPVSLISEMEDVSVHVLHLVKDVRAYTISHLDRTKRAIAKGIPISRKKSSLNGFYQRFAAYHFLVWYKHNRSILEFLEANKKIRGMRIGYEELCLYPQQIMRSICNFLEVGFEDQMTEITAPRTNHILKGNTMRHADRIEIRYDNRWFYRGEWQLPALTFPHIMNFNSRTVYSNSKSGR